MDENEEGRGRPSFLAQLRKRQVFRAAVSYGVVAFAILQLVSAIGRPIGIDDAGMRWLLLGLILGFPLFIAAAWYLEVSDTRYVSMTDSKRGTRGSNRRLSS